MRTITFYAITLLLLLFVLYAPTPFLIGLFAIWILWHLVKLINHYWIAHQFHIQLIGENQSEIEEGKQLEIIIQHRSLLPLYAARLQVEFTNALTSEKRIDYIPLTMARKDEQKILLQYKLAQCGHWTIRTTEMISRNYVSGSQKTYKATARQELFIYPKQFPMAVQTIGQPFELVGMAKQQQITTTQDSERFGFRAYRKGDAIKQIHWKLSAKQDELIVSEHIEEQQTLVQFYIEKPMDTLQYDILLSLLFSMLSACAKANKSGVISINGVQYSIANLQEIAEALLTGQRCDQPKNSPFIAIVSNERIENGVVFCLKKQASDCHSPYDFTSETMRNQFATLVI